MFLLVSHSTTIILYEWKTIELHWKKKQYYYSFQTISTHTLATHDSYNWSMIRVMSASTEWDDELLLMTDDIMVATFCRAIMYPLCTALSMVSRTSLSFRFIQLGENIEHFWFFELCFKLFRCIQIWLFSSLKKDFQRFDKITSFPFQNPLKAISPSLNNNNN